jgi:hypothetical protein
VCGLGAKIMGMTVENTTSAKSDWARENELGHEKADLLVAKIRDTRAPNILGHEIKDMLDAGRWSGFEVGFFHRLSQHLL